MKVNVDLWFNDGSRYLPPGGGGGAWSQGVLSALGPGRGGVWSQLGLLLVLGVGWWYPSMSCRFPGLLPRGKLRGIWPGGSPGPHPRGKLRGIWSRPTPNGEVEGGLAWGCGDPPLVTATAVGGTHPTGLHSCHINFWLNFNHLNVSFLICIFSSKQRKMCKNHQILKCVSVKCSC